MPLVHSAHTLAKVKNAAMADDDEPEPRGRLIGEEQVVAEADRLIANTAAEARELIELYGADPDRIDVVAAGGGHRRVQPRRARRGRASRCGSAQDERGHRVRRPDPAAEGPGRAGQGACDSCAGRHPERPMAAGGRRRRVRRPAGGRAPARRARGRGSACRNSSTSGRRCPRPSWSERLPRGRRRRGAQLQRVVRAGRAGGAGRRHAGGRRGGRRPDGGGGRRRQRAAGGRPRPADLGRCAGRGRAGSGPTRTRMAAGCTAARRPVLLGRHRGRPAGQLRPGPASGAGKPCLAAGARRGRAGDRRTSSPRR